MSYINDPKAHRRVAKSLKELVDYTKPEDIDKDGRLGSFGRAMVETILSITDNDLISDHDVVYSLLCAAYFVQVRRVLQAKSPDTIKESLEKVEKIK